MNDFQPGTPGSRPDADSELAALRLEVDRLRQDVDATLAELHSAGLVGSDRHPPPGLLGGVAALETFGEGSLAQLGLGPWIGLVACGVRAAPLLTVLTAACFGWTLASIVRR